MARPILHPSGNDFSYTISRNGLTYRVTFPATTSVQMQIIPQYDAANRMAKYQRWRMTLDVVMIADDVNGLTSMDDATDYLHFVLSTPGGSLKLYNLGFGSWFNSASGALEINDDRDVAFGPHPLELRIKPVGGSRAMHIYWAVEFTIPICNISPNFNGFAEFTYTAEFALDQAGVLTRTISMLAEFPVKRNGQGITASADDLLDQIKPPRLPGFHRERRRSLSADKRVLNYTITDTEIPSDNAYFLGMVRMDVRQRVRNSLSILTGGNFVVELSGTLEHAAGFTKAQCWEAARLIIRQRVQLAIQARMPTSQKQPSSLILMGISVEDELFARRISFTFSWRVMCNLDSLFAATGLFQPVEANWEQWSQGMDVKIPDRGRLGLRHKAADDVLLSFCHQGTPGKGVAGPANKLSPFPPTTITPGPINEESGWDWAPVLSLYRTSKAMILPTVGGGNSGSQNTVRITQGSTGPIGDALRNFLSGYSTGFTASAATTAGATYFAGTSQSNKSTSTVHDRAAGDYEVVFRGTATRIGKPPPIPSVKTIGGLPPVAIGTDSIEPAVIVMMTASGPMYRVRWFRRYAIPKFEGEVKVEIENAPPTNNLTSLSATSVQ